MKTIFAILFSAHILSAQSSMLLLTAGGSSGTALANPTFSPVDGTTNPGSVAITYPAGSQGCYATSGPPSQGLTAGTCGAGWTNYTTSITVSVTETIYAYATEVAHTNSLTVHASYTVTGGTFGTPSVVVNNNTTASATTVTKTTTAGDLLYIYGTGSPSGGCGGFIGGDGIQLPTATGGETISAVPITGAGIGGLQVISGGTGYSGLSCSITGAGSASCTATQSMGAITSMAITNAGALVSSASPATVSVSGGGGTGFSGIVSAYCIQDAATGIHTAWYAPNIPGTTGEVFTLDTSLSGFAFNTLGVAEISGANATTPFDAVGSAVNTSGAITSSSFNTSGADVVFCSSRVENDPSTWTAGSGFALVPGAPNGGGSMSFSSIQYETFATSQTGLAPSITSGSSGDKSIVCAAFVH